MSGVVLLALSGIWIIIAYLLYGRYVARKWGIDPNKPTPAHEFNDGVDFVPAKKSILFGHEFATIAGAGPIVGPIIAAMFGWLPVFLWILIGGVFVGAVHDFAAMYASVKNKGRSIGYVIELYIGKTGTKLFLVFTWLFAILIAAAFADIVAETFNGFAETRDARLANASAAATSMLFMIAAVAFGLYMRTKPNHALQVFVALILLTVCIALGLGIPIFLSKNVWLYIVFGYAFVSCITPVWILLQPRDYLNFFLLIAMMLCAGIGIFVTNPVINLPAFSGFAVTDSKGGVQYLFPILFVTVACGAVSGFHSLAASGTASKQVNNERDMLSLSFGVMLLESFLAVIALIAVGTLSITGAMPSGTPLDIFSRGISKILAETGCAWSVVYSLITLSISAFALTTLDSALRIARLTFQEFFRSNRMDDLNNGKTSLFVKIMSSRYVATAVTLMACYLLATYGYKNIWFLFGSSNQLLATLTLIACMVFLKKTNRSNFMLYTPCCFMFAVSFSALGINIYNILTKQGFSIAIDGVPLVLAVLIFALGVVVAVQAVKALFVSR
jgi:carbon starvation protein